MVVEDINIVLDHHQLAADTVATDPQSVIYVDVRPWGNLRIGTICVFGGDKFSDVSRQLWNHNHF